jgi:hypothetical protein
MKTTVAVVAFLMLSTVASAQNSGGVGISKPIMHSLPAIPPTIFNATSAHGDDSYSPSLFISWDDAIRYVPEQKPETLGDAARANREQKKKVHAVN